MTDRPMLFKPEMILALLREIKCPGTGKTNTRRVLKLPSWSSGDIWGLEQGEDGVWRMPTKDGNWKPLPIAQIGDRIWAREAFKLAFSFDPLSPSKAKDYWENKCNSNIGFSLRNYLADDRMGTLYEQFENTCGTAHSALFGRSRPSLFMPRWVSRITLLVTDVRVQRLQKISKEDAEAEGVTEVRDNYYRRSRYFSPHLGENPPIEHFHKDPRLAFRDLWNSINAAPRPVYWKDKNGKKTIGIYVSYPWEEGSRMEEHKGKPHFINGNPWVVATTFKPVLKNIDQMEEAG